MPEIIALVGYARSGKDEVAKGLKRFGFERISFADPIRDAIYTLNPMVTENGLRIQNLVDTLGWDNVKVQYPEIRRLLQILGTEVAREQWADSFWIDLAFSKMEDNGKYVITDCRFPNEAAAVAAHGGTLWRVSRPGVGPVNNHASDNYIEQIPVSQIINNNSDLQGLEVLVGLLYQSTQPLTV
jgi:hypothetical protein